MKSLDFTRFALNSCAAAAMFAGCGASQPPIGVNYSPTQSASSVNTFPDRGGKAPKYRVLYSFGNPPSGSDPLAALINVGGKLYGTTAAGGLYSNLGTLGIIFSITPSGKENSLYSFQGGSFDGANPVAALINVNGTLYGTTKEGGPDSIFGGSVFSITTSGREKVLHFFGSLPDGIWPYASLLDVNGTFYGTTDRGGAYDCPSYGGCGTVFLITKDGTEKVLHSFGGKKDGAFPAAGLIDVNGTLYGTTSGGGEHAKKKVPYEGGVVFSITTGGEEKVLHSFGERSDGAVPDAGLVDVNGTLYGTTKNGGAYYNSCGNGVACGTVFSITTAGKEKVLHSFGYGYRTDGCLPVAALVYVKGTLYGTASACGGYGRSEEGNGTIFSVTTGGKETTLHRFHGEGDGWRPLAGLINESGTLYGTTAYGGYGSEYGNGTVFALTP